MDETVTPPPRKPLLAVPAGHGLPDLLVRAVVQSVSTLATDLGPSPRALLIGEESEPWGSGMRRQGWTMLHRSVPQVQAGALPAADLVILTELPATSRALLLLLRALPPKLDQACRVVLVVPNPSYAPNALALLSGCSCSELSSLTTTATLPVWSGSYAYGWKEVLTRLCEAGLSPTKIESVRVPMALALGDPGRYPKTILEYLYRENPDADTAYYIVAAGTGSHAGGPVWPVVWPRPRSVATDGADTSERARRVHWQTEDEIRMDLQRLSEQLLSTRRQFQAREQELLQHIQDTRGQFQARERELLNYIEDTRRQFQAREQTLLRSIQELDTDRRSLAKELGHLRGVLAAIENSLAWHVIGWFRGTRLRLMRPGGICDRLYVGLRRNVRTIMRLGAGEPVIPPDPPITGLEATELDIPPGPPITRLEATELDMTPAPPEPLRPMAATSAPPILALLPDKAGLHILCIEYRFPRFDQDAGSLRLFTILKILRSLGHQVTFFSNEIEPAAHHAQALTDLGIRMIAGGLFRERVADLQRDGCDVVLISREANATDYLALVKETMPSAFVIFDTVDISFLRTARQAAVEQDRSLSYRALVLKHRELDAARKSDMVWVVSEADRDCLLREDPKIESEVVSLIQDAHPAPAGFAHRAGLLFLGGFEHRPNVDAVLYFAEEIFPVIRTAVSGIGLTVVGSQVPPEIQTLHDPGQGITVLGYVEDLTAVLMDHRVFVAPLRYGAGVKGKILHALSHGLPTVTTTIGAEGMGLRHQETVLIADLPSAFAEQTITLYTDEALWTRLSSAGRQYLQAHYSTDVARRQIMKTLDPILRRRHAHGSVGWENRSYRGEQGDPQEEDQRR